jgi:hypothetical protein
MDRLSEAHVSATIRENATKEVISHDSPTDSIRLPILDAIAASHMALNALYFNGNNPEVDEPSPLVISLLLPLAFFLSLIFTTSYH